MYLLWGLHMLLYVCKCTLQLCSYVQSNISSHGVITQYLNSTYTFQHRNTLFNTLLFCEIIAAKLIDRLYTDLCTLKVLHQVIYSPSHTTGAWGCVAASKKKLPGQYLKFSLCTYSWKLFFVYEELKTSSFWFHASVLNNATLVTFPWLIWSLVQFLYVALFVKATRQSITLCIYVHVLRWEMCFFRHVSQCVFIHALRTIFFACFGTRVLLMVT